MEPAAGVTYFILYYKVWLNLNLVYENSHIRHENRTTNDHLRLQLKQGADVFLGKIQEAVGVSDTTRVVTDMGEIIIPNIDVLAMEADIPKTLQIALEKDSTLALINVWGQRDGSPRAHMKLPRSDAYHLIDNRLLIGSSGG